MAEGPGLTLSLESDAAHDVSDFMKNLNSKSDDESCSSRSSGNGSVKKSACGKGKSASAKKTKKDKVKTKKHNKDKDWRKCKTCTKWKEITEFNDQQSKCRDCYNDVRSLARLATRHKIQKGFGRDGAGRSQTICSLLRTTQVHWT